MRIIVDANIVFSAILNTNGKIGDLLINSKKYFDFIAPDFLRTEIRKHYPKLMKISGLNLDQLQEAEFQVYKDLKFISEEQISITAWEFAYHLTHDVDPNDTPYIAYSKHFRCKIWSGDKVFINGLDKKGFKSFLSTEDIFTLRESKLNKE
ncbi:hypothetical protein HYN59_09420 [Flavobacterium album]|uniref:PIN domain-containing protein n=1 Tax=Flavobacterium album TaxID=2175091 RepID=A0A2S1QY44_9FLAO|nr:PIN domain-containing protein [Flavobacterium album]AWH85323.1 hypothetical protein HYN59_09420 [Flavobacterium album]